MLSTHGGRDAEDAADRRAVTPNQPPGRRCREAPRDWVGFTTDPRPTQRWTRRNGKRPRQPIIRGVRDPAVKSAHRGGGCACNRTGRDDRRAESRHPDRKRRRRTRRRDDARWPASRTGRYRLRCRLAVRPDRATDGRHGVPRGRRNQHAGSAAALTVPRADRPRWSTPSWDRPAGGIRRKCSRVPCSCSVPRFPAEGLAPNVGDRTPWAHRLRGLLEV